MDVSPRVDHLLSKAVDEQVSEQRLIRQALEDVNARLTRVESITGALADKIEPWSDPSAATADLAVRVEKRIGKRFDELAAALDDMAAVADELRKGVAELARLLVRDRNRISRALTEHRNAILAELRLPAGNGRSVDLRDTDVDDDDTDGNGGNGRPAGLLLRRLRGL